MIVGLFSEGKGWVWIEGEWPSLPRPAVGSCFGRNDEEEEGLVLRQAQDERLGGGHFLLR